MSPSTKKAQRAKARARYERYLERREHKLRRQRMWRRVGYGALILAVLAGLGYVGVRALAGSSTDPAALQTQPSPKPAPAPTTVKPVVAGCDTAVVKPIASPPQFDQPGQALTGAKPATLRLQTNCGDIDIALDTAAAPDNSNNLAFLANQAWYDASACHRLTTKGIYVLQCGDPTGTGNGGPGYTVPNENVPKDGRYPAGSVAMAEPQGGDAGNQFFIVYRDSMLPAAYSLVGTVTQGLDRVKQVAAAGVQGGGYDGRPAQPVVIKRATVQAG